MVLFRIVFDLIIMGVCLCVIIYMSNIYNNLKEVEDIKEKVKLFLFHFFFTSWFIVAPGYIYVSCFANIIQIFYE